MSISSPQQLIASNPQEDPDCSDEILEQEIRSVLNLMMSVGGRTFFCSWRHEVVPSVLFQCGTTIENSNLACAHNEDRESTFKRAIDLLKKIRVISTKEAKEMWGIVIDTYVGVSMADRNASEFVNFHNARDFRIRGVCEFYGIQVQTLLKLNKDERRAILREYQKSITLPLILLRKRIIAVLEEACQEPGIRKRSPLQIVY